MTSILYFAYGSNMLTQRLAVRCPSARSVGVAYAPNHALEFSKKNADTSGKATLVPYENAKQYGVLFHISRDELSTLDAIEGVGFGYERNDVFSVISASNGERLLATTYIATTPEQGLKPFDWYLALVIAGAQQHNLPTNQLETFQQTPFIVDAQTNRPTRLKSLKALQVSGETVTFGRKPKSRFGV